jgi:hypothetical protein
VLKTNWKSVPPVEIPIQGVVAGDIVIAGRGWDSRTGVLTMGSVQGRHGVEWPLIIVVRGPHARDVKLKPERVEPGLIDVELGPTVHIDDKALCQTRLTIRIPPGSQPAMHLGSEQGEPGRITLQTNHPEVPELDILVRFAIKE